MVRQSYCLILLVTVWGSSVATAAETVQMREDCTRDPKWESRNNVGDPSHCVDKLQDFGFSSTNHAGGSAGEIGGRVWRSLTPAYYGKKVATRSLNDRLHASGRFSVTQCEGSSGVLVGWFNSVSRGWRTPNSLVFRIDGEQDCFRVFFEYGTQTWKTGGGTTFEGPYQTTRTPMIPADGKPHSWSLDYDPAGAEGNGEMIFVLDGQKFAAPMEKGHRAEGAVFDRFGIMNVQNSGQWLKLWLDDLEVDGEREEFAANPNWDASGNRLTFSDCAIRPWHNFGWRETCFAGGKPGQIGGLVWRIESTRPQEALSYGIPVGELLLGQELKASGRLCLKAAGADSGILFGWYNSLTAIGAPPANFAGIFVEGPSAVGHCVRPALRTADDIAAIAETGPIIRPDGRPHVWTIHHRPGDRDRAGKVTVTLDDRPVSLDVSPSMYAGDAALDRFGFLSWHRGGHYVEIYFDDLEYTANAAHTKQSSTKR